MSSTLATEEVVKLKEIVCAKTSDASRVRLSEYFEVSAFRGNLRDQGQLRVAPGHLFTFICSGYF